MDVVITETKHTDTYIVEFPNPWIALATLLLLLLMGFVAGYLAGRWTRQPE